MTVQAFVVSTSSHFVGTSKNNHSTSGQGLINVIGNWLSRVRAILKLLDIPVDIGVSAEKEVIQ